MRGARGLLLTHLLPTCQLDEITELAEAAFGGRVKLVAVGHGFER